MKYVFILLGGGAGAVARFVFSRWVLSWTSTGFPWGTMAVNLLGCFLIGFLTGVFERWLISPNLRLFVFVGVLGGFTTFSSFGLETFSLFRDGDVRSALFNLFFSNVLGIALVFGGYFAAQGLSRIIK